MFNHINKYIGKTFYVVVFLTLLVSVMEIAMLSIMMPIMSILSGQEVNNVTFLNSFMEPILENYLILLVVIGLLVGLVSYIQGKGIAKVRTGYEYNIRSLIFNNLIKADWRVSSEYNNSFLYSSITEEVNRNSMALNYLFSIINLVSLTVLYLSTSAMISLKFTLIALSIFGVIFLLMKNIIKRSKAIGVEMNDTNDSFYNSVNEYLSNIRYIKQNKIENYVIDIYTKVLKKLWSLRYEGVLKSFTIKAIYDPVVIIVIALMVWIAKELNLNMGEFLVLLVIIYRLAPRTSQLQRDYHEYLLYLPSIEKVEGIIENKKLSEHSDIVINNSLKNDLVVENLNFDYARFSLKINNLEAKVGQITTIIGKSGSGKTTLVDIISGIRDDFKGKIYYPKELKSFSEIEYVTQDSVLFNSSVYENIILDSNASKNDVKIVCKNIGIDDLIKGLEYGYEHVVKNSGGEFSGGQKQRLMLARALVKNPKILILDESTSALDNETEREIMKLLRQIKKEYNLIIIMIAHRTSTILESDYIYMLESGEVVLSGDISEVKKTDRFKEFIEGSFNDK